MKDFSVEYSDGYPVYRSIISGPEISDTLKQAQSVADSDWQTYVSSQMLYGGNHGYVWEFDQVWQSHLTNFLGEINVTIPTHISPEVHMSWLLRLDEDSRPFIHCHPSAWISGVIHLEDWDNGGWLTFQGGLQYPSKIGQIFLFDSNHLHWVEKYDKPEKRYRYSVAFDIFPRGVTKEDLSKLTISPGKKAFGVEFRTKIKNRLQDQDRFNSLTQ